jgi:hypothetical protein
MMKLSHAFLCTAFIVNLFLWSASCLSAYTNDSDDLCENTVECCIPKNNVWASALVWKTYVDGLEYAIFSTVNRVSTLGGQQFVLDNDFDLKEINQKPAGGFEAGYSRVISCDGWSLGGMWTFFGSHGHASGAQVIIDLPDDQLGLLGNDVNDIWSMHSIGDAPSSIEGFIRTRYNTFDFLLNKDTCMSEYFVLGTAFGIKAAFIDEQLKVNLDEPDSIPLVELNLSEMRIHNDFKGVGPSVVFAPTYLLNYGFSIGAQLGISALIGQFNLNKTQAVVGSLSIELSRLDGNSWLFDYVAKLKKTRIQPVINLVLGVDWKYDLSTTTVGLGVAYEINYWINFIRQERVSNAAFVPQFSTQRGKTVQQRHGDLAVHGLVLTLFAQF